MLNAYDICCSKCLCKNKFLKITNHSDNRDAIYGGFGLMRLRATGGSSLSVGRGRLACALFLPVLVAVGALSAGWLAASLWLPVWAATLLLCAWLGLGRARVMLAELRLMFERSANGIALLAPNGRWLRVNPSLCAMVGYRADALLRLNFQQLIHPDDVRAALQTHQRLLSGEMDSAVCEQRYLHADGHTIWVHLSFSLIRHRDGRPKFWVLMVEDIRARKQAEHQLRLAAKVFDCAGEAMFMAAADGRILSVNQAFSTITGYSASEALGLRPTLLSSGRHGVEFYRALWQQLLEQGCWQGEIWNKRKNGEIYPEWLTINRVDPCADELANYVAIFSDISSIKNAQCKLEYLARHDELTMLANRTVFQEQLGAQVALAQSANQPLAVLFIDLDNFKTINDTLGHDVGDQLLKLVAQRLLAAMRAQDTLARLGGDEFAALLYPVDGDEVDRICQRLADALSQPFWIGSAELFVTASMGVSLCPLDGDDPSTLLRHADAAMYRAKERGKNRIQFFVSDIKQAAERRLRLETGLRHALRHDLLRLHYQPKISMVDDTLVGAEALLRWTDTELGEISPTEFIAVAEKAGLISSIGRFVVGRALRDILSWRAGGLDAPPIALNISPTQLRDERFVDWLYASLAEAELPCSSIVVELTEGALMDQSEAGLSILNNLASRGIKISIDDFGTGYSSLSYLRRMPITELKIDRSFVDGIAEDADNCSIACAILSLAHSLGISEVAEGVETESQLTVLRRLGCETAQGYFYHRPMDETHFRQLLRDPGGVAQARATLH